MDEDEYRKEELALLERAQSSSKSFHADELWRESNRRLVEGNCIVYGGGASVCATIVLYDRENKRGGIVHASSPEDVNLGLIPLIKEMRKKGSREIFSVVLGGGKKIRPTKEGETMEDVIKSNRNASQVLTAARKLLRNWKYAWLIKPFKVKGLSGVYADFVELWTNSGYVKYAIHDLKKDKYIIDSFSIGWIYTTERTYRFGNLFIKKITADGGLVPNNFYGRREKSEKQKVTIVEGPKVIYDIMAMNCVILLLYDRENKIGTTIHVDTPETAERLVQPTIDSMKDKGSEHIFAILAGGLFEHGEKNWEKIEDILLDKKNEKLIEIIPCDEIRGYETEYIALWMEEDLVRCLVIKPYILGMGIYRSYKFNL